MHQSSSNSPESTAKGNPKELSSVKKLNSANGLALQTQRNADKIQLFTQEADFRRLDIQQRQQEIAMKSHSTKKDMLLQLEAQGKSPVEIKEYLDFFCSLI